MTSECWNPYHTSISNNQNLLENLHKILDNYINDNVIYILGPRNKLGEHPIYKFSIFINEKCPIFFEMCSDSENMFYPTLRIRNNILVEISNDDSEQEKSCEIVNITKNSKNSGKDLIEWAKYVITVLGFTSIYFNESTYITNLEINKILSNSSFNGLSFLKKRISYFSQFNINPYTIIKNNKIDIIQNSELVQNKIHKIIVTVNWNKLDELFLNDANYNKIKEKYKVFSPLYALKYFDPETLKKFIDMLESYQEVNSEYIIDLKELNKIFSRCKFLCFLV